jgi:hypothetical protein
MGENFDKVIVKDGSINFKMVKGKGKLQRERDIHFFWRRRTSIP